MNVFLGAILFISAILFAVAYILTGFGVAITIYEKHGEKRGYSPPVFFTVVLGILLAFLFWPVIYPIHDYFERKNK